MFSFYFRFTLLLTLLLMVSSAAMLATGGAQPINPALRGFVERCEGAEGLCWYGITQGVTQQDVAQQILAREGYTFVGQDRGLDALSQITHREMYQRDAGCFQVVISYPPDLPNPEVTLESLHYCRGIYLADMIATFGTPLSIRRTPPPIEGGTILFRHEITVDFDGSLQFYAPLTSVRLARFDPVGLEWAFQWHGVVPMWRYCQFEPSTLGC